MRSDAEIDAFSGILGTTPNDSSVAAFPTRRELRAKQDAASAPVLPRRTRRALGSRSTGRRSNTARRAAAPAVPVTVAPPIYVSSTFSRKKTRPMRKRFSALLTMVAVGGLFASAGLPAYAMTNSGTGITDAVAALDSTTLSVSEDIDTTSASRETFSATTPGNLAAQRSTAAQNANYEAYMKSGAIEAGDDYPWFSELANTQGGGLSPLNYFYRECVDFVAWRLNRDAGTTQAPFAYDWSYLTPNGGNASAWAGNWAAHGWETSNIPVVGSVAWFNGNHVAYVNAVNDDGTVTIEEYNWGSNHTYNKRTIPSTDVALFLYAPPR